MKTQIIIIHGGEAFKKRGDYIKYLKNCPIDFERLKNPKNDWKKTLAKKLGRNYEVILPTMPNKFNAKYVEWAIWFKRLIPHFNKEVILIGHSLGGLFIAKYLSENNFPKKIHATFLIAAPYDNQNSKYALADFALPDKLDNFQKQSYKIFLYQSQDDPVVPCRDLKKYAKALPTSQPNIFKNRGHFNQKEFPELAKKIKKLFQT